MSDDAYNEITVFFQNDWFLRIYLDGGGVYGFGDGGPPFCATIPRGTFTLSAVIRDALAVSEKRGPADGEAHSRRMRALGWYSLGLGRRGSSLMESRDTGDTDFGRALFGTAVTAMPPGPELAQLLRTKPPFPAKATTRPAPPQQRSH